MPEMDSAGKITSRVVLRSPQSTFMSRLVSINTFYTKITENRKFRSFQKKSLLYNEKKRAVITCQSFENVEKPIFWGYTHRTVPTFIPFRPRFGGTWVPRGRWGGGLAENCWPLKKK